MRSIHETRNFVMVLLMVATLVWSALVWFVFSADQLIASGVQRSFSLLACLSIGVWLVYAFKFEAKLPDHLREVAGDIYYSTDGLDFLPTIRARNDRAQLSVYYQNRFENPAQMIVHLRPAADFVVQAGMGDLHFAFTVGGGDYGVIHQPIAVPEHLQGEVIDIELAAATYYPRSHGARLRKDRGIPCGTLNVDWGGAAFRIGVHETSGEVDLIRPTTIHLSLPIDVASTHTGDTTWRQERLVAGPEQ